MGLRGENLILNPGFETAGGGGADVFDWWSEDDPGDGEILDETVDVHSGGHAAHLVANNDGATLYKTFTVEPLHRFVLSIWSHGAGGSGGYITILDLPHGSVILYYDVQLSLSGDYERFNVFFTVPADCGSIQIQLTSGSQEAFWDDAELLDLDDITWIELTDIVLDPPLVFEGGLPGDKLMDLLASTGTLTFYLDNSLNNNAGLPGLYSPDHANVLDGFEIGTPIRIDLEIEMGGMLLDDGAHFLLLDDGVSHLIL